MYVSTYVCVYAGVALYAKVVRQDICFVVVQLGSSVFRGRRIRIAIGCSHHDIFSRLGIMTGNGNEDLILVRKIKFLKRTNVKFGKKNCKCSVFLELGEHFSAFRTFFVVSEYESSNVLGALSFNTHNLFF